jgi:hypothetical protein
MRRQNQRTKQKISRQQPHTFSLHFVVLSNLITSQHSPLSNTNIMSTIQVDVFDLSSMHHQHQHQHQQVPSSPSGNYKFGGENGGALEEDESECASTCSLSTMTLPPEEEYFLCSSSRSSSSSSSSSPKRSIFGAYWERTSKQPIQLFQGELQESCSIPARNNSGISRAPPVAPSPATAVSAAQQEQSPGRRSILPNKRYHSYSNTSLSTSSLPLPSSSKPVTMERRAVSSSELELGGSRRASCLRPSRFSSSERSAVRRDSSTCSTSSSATSVRFDTTVQVFHFQRPLEIWSADGWAKFFSS